MICHGFPPSSTAAQWSWLQVLTQVLIVSSMYRALYTLRKFDWFWSREGSANISVDKKALLMFCQAWTMICVRHGNDGILSSKSHFGSQKRWPKMRAVMFSFQIMPAVTYTQLKCLEVNYNIALKVYSLCGCNNELRGWYWLSDRKWNLSCVTVCAKQRHHLCCSCRSQIPATCDRQSLGRCVETTTEKEQGVHLGLILSNNLDLQQGIFLQMSAVVVFKLG